MSKEEFMLKQLGVKRTTLFKPRKEREVEEEKDFGACDPGFD